jgi:ribosomal protein S18 acetylase RimI-like enzyme
VRLLNRSCCLHFHLFLICQHHVEEVLYGCIFKPLEAPEIEPLVALWQRNCADLGTPCPYRAVQQIRTNMYRYGAEPDAYCFAAVDAGAVVGYLTCALTSHPIMPGRAGKIEELYVIRGRGRRAIEVALVQRAVRTLQQHDATSIHVRTGVDRDETRRRAFWRQLGWANDMTIFSIYSNVPGAPALQQVLGCLSD